MKKLFNFNSVLRDQNLNTPIQIFMSTLTAGQDYDGFANNYTPTVLNPVTIYGYVRDLTPETAFWKQYGLYQAGMKEIICKDMYEQYFKLATQIWIDGKQYEVFKEGTGNKTMITKRPGQLLRVVISSYS